MNTIDPRLNPLEVLVIEEELRRRGVDYYDMRPGNDCVWVSYNRLETYWIFRQGKLVDIQID
jgi:hypothetical protein